MKKRSGIIKGIFLGVVGCVLLLFPSIAQNRYQIHIVNMAGIYILLSLGLNLAMGYAGQFNLAIGALWGVGAYTAALLNTRLGIPFWLNLPAVTIGLGEVINIILVNQEELTGGALGIPRIQMPGFFGIPLNNEERFYYVILITVVLGYLIARQIVRHRIGRSFRAIRDDYQAAKAMGVNTGYYQILAFVISAAYAGAAGALFAHLNTYISPDIFEFKSTLFVMTMTMVGGMGNLLGSLIGGLALPLLQEYLRVIGDWQLVGYGVAIMIVVLFMPGGVIELSRRLETSRKIRMSHLAETVEEKPQAEEPNVPRN
jgi:branched-chain amino acid transport system permease protein